MKKNNNEEKECHRGNFIALVFSLVKGREIMMLCLQYEKVEAKTLNEND